MKRKINARPTLIFIPLLILVTVAGCQRAGAEKAAAVDETGKDEPVTTDAADGGATSSEERGAVVRAGDGKAVVKSGEAEASADGVARAGDAVAGDGRARAGEVVAGDGEAEVEKDGADARPGKDRVKLKIGGEPGTQFSGSCDLGGEKREVSGQVPEQFVYDLEGRGIACEIHNKTGTGQLKFFVNIGGARKQEIKATADNVSFSFSGDSLSYATSSHSDGASSHKTKIISSSSSSVSSSSGR